MEYVDAQKNVLTDLYASFILVVRNKWLLLGPLFLSLSAILYSAGTALNYWLATGDFYGSTFNSEHTGLPSNTISINDAIASIDVIGLASSLSFVSIFGMASIVLALIICFKYFNNILKNFSYIAACVRYSIFGILLGIIVSIFSIYVLQNPMITILGSLTALVGLYTVGLTLLTIVEGALIAYLKSVFHKEQPSVQLSFLNAGTIFKALFGFNLILLFISPAFFLSVVLLPDLLNAFSLGAPDIYGSFFSQNTFLTIYSLIKYLQTFWIVVFIFVPFIVAIRTNGTLIVALRENVLLISKSALHYLLLVAAGLLFLMLLSIAYTLLPQPPIFTPLLLLKEFVYSLIRIYIVLIFSLATFRHSLRFA